MWHSVRNMSAQPASYLGGTAATLVGIVKPVHEQGVEAGEKQVESREFRQGCSSKSLQGKAIILQSGWTFILLPATLHHGCGEGTSYWRWSCGYSLYHSSVDA